MEVNARFSFLLTTLISIGLLAAGCTADDSDSQDAPALADDAFVDDIPLGDSGKGDHGGVIYSRELREDGRWTIGLAHEPAERIYQVIEAAGADVRTRTDSTLLLTKNVRCILRDGTYGCAIYTWVEPGEHDSMFSITDHEPDPNSAAITLYRGLVKMASAPADAKVVQGENIRCFAPDDEYRIDRYSCHVIASAEARPFDDPSDGEGWDEPPYEVPDETNDDPEVTLPNHTDLPTELEQTAYVNIDNKEIITGQAALFIFNLIERTGDFMSEPGLLVSEHFTCEGKVPSVNCEIDVSGFGTRREINPTEDIVYAFMGEEDSAAAELYERILKIRGKEAEDVSLGYDYGSIECGQSNPHNFSCTVAITGNYTSIDLSENPEVAYTFRNYFESEVALRDFFAGDLLDLFEMAGMMDEYGEIDSNHIRCMIGPEGKFCRLNTRLFELAAEEPLASSPSSILSNYSEDERFDADQYLFKISANNLDSAGGEILKAISQLPGGYDDYVGLWECYNGGTESASFCYFKKAAG